MRAKVTVLVRLRPGILDPQGKAIEESLPALGFDHVAEVRVGKAIELLVEGRDLPGIDETVRRMCEAFLTNPVIEEYELTIEELSEDRNQG